MITRLWHPLKEGTHGLRMKTILGKGNRNRGCKRIRNDMAIKYYFEVTLTKNLIVVVFHEGIKRIRSLIPEETCRTITLQRL